MERGVQQAYIAFIPPTPALGVAEPQGGFGCCDCCFLRRCFFVAFDVSPSAAAVNLLAVLWTLHTYTTVVHVFFHLLIHPFLFLLFLCVCVHAVPGSRPEQDPT